MSSTIPMDNSEVTCESTTNSDITEQVVEATSTSENIAALATPQLVSVQNNPQATSTPTQQTFTPLQLKKLPTNIFPFTQPFSSSPKNVILTANNTIKPKVLVNKATGLIQFPIPVTLDSKHSFKMLNKTSQEFGIPNLPNQKLLLTPFQALSTGNRLPTTVTTNSLQTKFSLLPHPLEHDVPCKPNVFNIRIANGQIQSDSSRGIKVMCSDVRNDPKYTLINNEGSSKSDNLNASALMPWNNNLSHNNNLIIKNKATYNIDSASLSNKDSNKIPKHGISILKKNIFADIKCEKVNNVITVTNPIITTISDTKAGHITTNASSSEETVINIVTAPLPKSERRRKSNFACRQDYDEIIFTENSSIQKPTLKKKKKKVEVECEPDIQMIIENNPPVINMNEDLSDINDILFWEDGIGTLPGSEIRFLYNKYGFLQLLTREEYIQMMNKKASKCLKIKASGLEEMCCLQCGCFGMPSEFISPKYCSYDCRDAGIKASKLKERKLRLRAINYYRKPKIAFTPISETPAEVTVEKEKEKFEIPITSEEEITSNENSLDKSDKYSIPWNCAKKGFSWVRYLDHVKAKAAPEKLFKDPFPYNRNGFKPGMKLEGIDPIHPSYFCVLTVAEVIGYRLRLRFDGYPANYDFWVNADSMDIFPAGWCEKYGHHLHPPPAYQNSEFNWSVYIKNTRSMLAPKHLFGDRGGSAICPNGFRIGMKLEAVDRKNTSLVCVATIRDMMDNRLLIHFDSWDDIYDYWVDPTSPYIHPVGWADKNGHGLTPPNDYKNPEMFTWENYIKDKKAVAAPVRAFKQKPHCGFKKGMRLESVDKRVPQLIRVATVDDVKEHQIRICFDGWPDRYSYWIDSDSTDIHPVGWCQKTGHPIEPPLTPVDVYEFLECPTIGCRGQGHIQGAINSIHCVPDDCPYSDENMYREHVLPDRLLSPDSQLESVVPVSREPKEKSKKSKGKRSMETDWNNFIRSNFENEDVKHNIVKKIKLEPIENDCTTPLLPLTNGYVNDDIEQIWEKHSKFLEVHIQNISNPRIWEEGDVVHFISMLPDCEKYSTIFKEHKIDGPALLMLSQKDLVEILNIKLGPAIKLYSIIVLLRRQTFS